MINIRTSRCCSVDTIFMLLCIWAAEALMGPGPCLCPCDIDAGRELI
jgi:hypothetical protein